MSGDGELWRDGVVRLRSWTWPIEKRKECWWYSGYTVLAKSVYILLGRRPKLAEE